MPTRQQLETALINADKAGDTQAAKALANAIRAGNFTVNEAAQQAQPQQEESSFLGDVGRVAGGLGMEAITGVNRAATGLLDLIITDRINNALTLMGQDTVPTLQQALIPQRGAFTAGTMAEGLPSDIASTAGEVAVGALTGQGLLQQGAKQLAPSALSTGARVLTEAARPGLASSAGLGAISGAGQEIGREVGGETGALIGAIAAPVVPALTSATVKRAFSGGLAGQKNIQQAINEFAEIGEVPTVGMATQSPLRQGLENLSSKVLGGQPIRRAIDRTQGAVDKRLSEIANRLSNVKGDYEAGLVINRGIKGEGGFVDRFVNKSSMLWRGFDDFVDDQARVTASNTTRTLGDLVNDTQFGKLLNNPVVSGIKQALDESGGVIDYRTFRQLRSSVGERLGSNDLVSDIPRTQLKRLYGALSEDLKNVAREAGPQAEKALGRANRFTAAGHQRLDDFVERLTNKVDVDKVFNAVTRGGEGIQSVRAIKRSLKPEEWEAVASNVVRKLGRAQNNLQDDVGEVFSLNKFLTDWNKLGRVKNEMFSGSEKLDQYRRNLDTIAKISSRFKDASREMQNPSQTGQFIANVGLISGGAGSLASGNLPAFAAIASAVAANSATARLMSSPRFVNWLAKAVKSPNVSASIASLSNVAKETGEYEAVDEIISSLQELRQQPEQQNR